MRSVVSVPLFPFESLESQLTFHCIFRMHGLLPYLAGIEIILTRCETRVFLVFEKMPKMQNVHLKCWNDKSHCRVSVVGLKSLDVSPCNELLLLPVIIKNFWPESTSSHISRHLEFIIEQGHRVNWVSGSLDSRVTGSLGHKKWPSSISDVVRWRACRDERRADGLRGYALVPSARAAGRRHAVRAAGRHLGDGVRLRRAHHQPPALARRIRRRPAVPHHTDPR